MGANTTHSTAATTQRRAAVRHSGAEYNNTQLGQPVRQSISLSYTDDIVAIFTQKTILAPASHSGATHAGGLHGLTRPRHQHPPAPLHHLSPSLSIVSYSTWIPYRCHITCALPSQPTLQTSRKTVGAVLGVAAIECFQRFDATEMAPADRTVSRRNSPQKLVRFWELGLASAVAALGLASDLTICCSQVTLSGVESSTGRKCTVSAPKKRLPRKPLFISSTAVSHLATPIRAPKKLKLKLKSQLDWVWSQQWARAATAATAAPGLTDATCLRTVTMAVPPDRPERCLDATSSGHGAGRASWHRRAGELLWH
ncbi:hypothetical protein EDC01DRAFT_205747 [Geopyxis carbonaria]|nr:hypothetical protein EDC01DRAFT_205747 [Geopyxis carbonaria]